MQVLRPLASLKITVTILVTLAVLLIGATWMNGYDITVGALRRDFYGSWWFNALLGLLMTNLVACTVIRKPWAYWQWGFPLTHAGVFTLMVGAGISFNWKVYGDMGIQEGSAADTFDVEGEREVVVRTGRGEESHRVEANPYFRSKPGQSCGTVRIEEYVPSIGEGIVYEPASDGRFNVVQLRLYFDGRLADEFHVALGETAGSRLLGFRYGPMDRLAEDGAKEGTLVVTVGGENRAIDVLTDTNTPVQVGGRRVVIRRFFSSFTVGSGGAEDVKENPDANPAVLFEVDGREYYAFALHPESSPMARGTGMHGAPPDFAADFRYTPQQSMIYIAPDLSYRVTSPSGVHLTGRLEPGARIAHPGAGRRLEFELVRRLERAEPSVVAAAPRKGRPAVPAIKVSAGREVAWLRLGETVTLAGGTVTFQPRAYRGLGFTVELLDFRNPPHEGTGRAMKFESDLRLHVGGRTIRGTTGVNRPFTYGGWTFYQSAYNDQVQPVLSILQVAHDPGKPILYIGCIMTAFGTLFMMLLKRTLADLLRTAKSAVDAPMGPVAWIGALATACAPTIVGAIVLLASPQSGALAVATASSLGGLALGLGLAALARRIARTRGHWALGLGRAVSLGWCLNAAAMAVLMLSRVS